MPVEAEGRSGDGTRLVTRWITWAQELESWEYYDGGDVTTMMRRVHDLDGNLLVQDFGAYPYSQNIGISAYEFDAVGNWTRREEAWRLSEPPYGWRSIARRVITYAPLRSRPPNSSSRTGFGQPALTAAAPQPQDNEPLCSLCLSGRPD